LLAATDASTRWWMTAGFVCFGVGVPLFAIALRQLVPGPAWIAAIVSGLATLGVAAFPLHVSTAVDRLHGTFASVGYVALALVPFFAARALSMRGQRLAATASRGVAAIAAVLAAMPLLETTADGWVGLGGAATGFALGFLLPARD